MSDKTTHEAASRLAGNSKVAARIAEIRAPAVATIRKQIRYELADAMREADQAIEMAKRQKSGGASAMAALITLKARINGLMVEDRGNARRKYESLTDEQLEAELQRVLAERAKPVVPGGG